MGSIRERKDNNKLFFDFYYKEKRCREQTALLSTPANRARLNKILVKIEAEITLGVFDYSKYFPNSKNARLFASMEKVDSHLSVSGAPQLKDFAEEWFLEKKVEWRETNIITVRQIIDKHIVPSFGRMPLNEISRKDIFNFRADLSKKKGRKDSTLSIKN